MKMIRGTLKLALVLYICAALSGVYVLSASARITPHTGDDDTMLITIVKGDTLWDLCQKHLKDPLRWRELSKYNDFTNPHLIYPGEELRIPLAMAKDVVQIAEDELAALRAALEARNAELAESEATREKLAAEMKQLNQDMKALGSQLSDLQEKLNREKDIGEDLAGVRKDIGEDLAGVRKDIGEDLAGIKKQIEKESQQTKADIKSVQGKLNATDDHVALIQADIKMFLAHIEANQKAINEVKMMLEDAKGVHEELSTSKRALVFLTTVAAGIGWFAISSIGGRSGE